MSSGGEKTEQPTAKKRSDARKKGNVPKSKDLSSAVQLLGAVTILKYIGPWMANQMFVFTNKMLSEEMPLRPVPEGKEIIPYVLVWMSRLGLIVMPFVLMVAAIALVAGILQVGFLFTTEPLKLNFNKFNPVAGLKRLFALKNIVMLIMNMAKLLVIMPVAWYTVFTEAKNVMVMYSMETAGSYLYMTERILSLAQLLAILLLILGFIDFIYQKYKNTKDLKMTKQEIKEEFKQMEGDPKVKQKRRQKQMEAAMQRMMSEVPQAEVVVRNPTHFAVAISYKPGMAAPVVVAKGKDKIAEKIIEAAREAGVPLVENPPLARQLYRSAEIGDHIPEELFATVAEILATVMNEDKKRQMMRELNGAAA